MIKILFVGSTNLSRAVLEKLIELKLCDVKGILSNSKKFQISYSQSLVTNFNFADLSEIAESNSISFYNLNSGMNEDKLQDWIESLEIEIIFSRAVINFVYSKSKKQEKEKNVKK